MPCQLAGLSVLATMFVLGGALAQGVVSFNNIQGVDPVLRPLLKQYNGVPLSKATGRIQLLDSDGHLISNPHNGLPTFGLATDGLFGLGHLTIPNSTPGSSAQVTFQVWDSSSGETYEAASEKLSLELSLVGLGGGDLPVPNLLEISSPNVYPNLPPGVKELKVQPIRGSDQIYLSAQLRQWTLYRLESSADLESWSLLDDVLTGSVDGPFYLEWVPIDIFVNQSTNAVTYFRLTGVSGSLWNGLDGVSNRGFRSSFDALPQHSIHR